MTHNVVNDIIRRSTLPNLTLSYLQGNINMRSKVLKGKIDSFDTKREQSPISHFHGSNLYTTLNGIQHFSLLREDQI